MGPQNRIDGGSWEGRKTNTFYNNVMVGDQTRSQGVTVDMHMMRVFGFDRLSKNTWSLLRTK